MKIQLLTFIVAVLTGLQGHATIVGKDDRVPMLNVHAFPWSAIGKLVMGQLGTCTATLVGPSQILTAAHCLVDSKTQKFHQVPIIFHSKFVNGRSLGLSANVIKYTVGTMNTQGQRWADWAVAELDRPLGLSLGYLGTVPFSGNEIALGQTAITLAGYSGDYQNGQTAGVHVNCHLKDLWIPAQQVKVVTHDCDTRPGSSGAALLQWIDNKPYIVGINVAELDKFNAVSRALGIEIPFSENSNLNLGVTADYPLPTINQYRQGR